MQHPLSQSTDPPAEPPLEVLVIRTLGHGRAAKAQLVDATFADGRVVRCVEKVFAPGILTRTIYRASFQAPFAYQSNRDAILASFYRRKVASAVVAASDIKASVAAPLYVRYDHAFRAWVLAAEWIQGRGIRPGPPDTWRIRRFFNVDRSHEVDPASEHEVAGLVDTMGQLETKLCESGLVGSGWQVAPRAMVSTANLLRTSDHYTIIDLESGIPAVLVPKYILSSIRQGSLPPFDDLDPERLLDWLGRNERLLLFRIGPETLSILGNDTRRLIEHSRRWKETELALLRRPWRLLSKHWWSHYRQECRRRWQQEGSVDAKTAETLGDRPWLCRSIWYSGLIPGTPGRLLQRILGNREERARATRWLTCHSTRMESWRNWIDKHQSRWTVSGRIADGRRLSTPSFLVHLALRRITTAGLHRFLTDSDRRRRFGRRALLMALSPRYQLWSGRRWIGEQIAKWESRERMTSGEANRLREQLAEHEVRVYTRGFAMHVALKSLAPVLIPAKVGGIAAFIATANLWFLLPLVATPVLRTLVTLGSIWMSRRHRVPHAEALAISWVPMLGSFAFPLQMFSTRSELSTFLIRDMAAKLGRKVPVYGGADSRTEMALIESADLLIEIIEIAATLVQPLVQRITRGTSGPSTSSDLEAVAIATPTSRFGRWLERIALDEIREAETIEISVGSQRKAA